MKRSELIFGALLVPVDFLMILIAGIITYFLRTSPLLSQWRPVLFETNLPFSRFFGILILVAIFFLIIFALSGLYKIRASRKLFETFSQVIISTSGAVLALIVFLFFTGREFESRFIILVSWGLSIVLILIGRFFVKKLQRYLVGKYNIGVHDILVIGYDKISKNIMKTIKRQPDLGYRIVKHFSELSVEKVKRATETMNIDAVIIATSKYERKEVLQIFDFCEEQRIGFKFVPSLFQALTTNIEIDTFGGVPLIEIKVTPLDGWGKITKRVVDIFGSFIGLILLSPVFLLVALTVKLDSSGPTLVKLKRVSEKKEFYLYKFRSMVKNAEALKEGLVNHNERGDGPLFKIKNDPRITRIGRVLRKTRIDELPQLINVFKGEISLIGPRPHQPDEIAKYERHHKRVLSIKSGITGLAQISGSSSLSFDEEVKLDSHYIETWSPKKDVYILLKTILVLFTDKSAC